MYKLLSFLIAMHVSIAIIAQEEPDSTHIINAQLDSIYIAEIEEVKGQKLKILHAEPIFIDLIRDLGARKGEKEWNVGFGITDKNSFDSYEGLIEYEFAPIDRVGLEIEIPVTIIASNNKETKDSLPSNRIESIKLAAQWSFLVSDKFNATLAIGYINEFLFSDLNVIQTDPVFQGNLYNPFFIAAKRWGNNFHTLIYTGPHIEQLYRKNKLHLSHHINTNIHYMIPGTRNFIGIEINKVIEDNEFKSVLRPQMRVGLADNLLIGIVGGIPINKNHERLSSFIRIIYEPGHKHK
ncbi:MAG: HAEPLYID family protein [Bacteroidia bacterium]